MLSGERVKLEQEQIPEYFCPVTGKHKIRGLLKLPSILSGLWTVCYLLLTCHLYFTVDLHKTFIDDESYNSGHGHAYDTYGVDVKKGAVAIVRPDQC